MSLVEIADEYGDLNLQCDHFRPTYDRRDALRTAIQAQFEAHPAEQSGWLDGERWRIELKPRINESKIVNIRKVARAMGAKNFWAAAQQVFNRALGLIKEAVGEAKFQELVSTNRTGYRKLVAIAKSPPVAA